MWKKNGTHVLAAKHRRHRGELEVFKAVAQAWFSHHNANPSTLAPNEFDARRLNFRGQPSRFRIEALRKSKGRDRDGAEGIWDFSQSLLDPYEIVAVSKRLEEGLVFLEEVERGAFDGRKRKESKNSLRNLFSMVSGWSKSV